MKLHIIFGGASFEHEISIVSAIALKKILPITHFIFLDSNHKFYLIDEHQMSSSFFAKGLYKKCKELFIDQNGFFHLEGLFKRKIYIQPAVIYSMVHGYDGESGHLSALLEFYRLPDIAPNLESCVLSFDKALTKKFAKDRGINILDYMLINMKETTYKLNTLQANIRKQLTLTYPLIIKPTRLGSSIGINVAQSEDELLDAIDKALEFDYRILIEPFLQDIHEYNLAGAKIEDEWHLSIIEDPRENRTNKDRGSLLNFEDKYLDFSRITHVKQANISGTLRNSLHEAFKKLYVDAFEGAIIRCDFFVINDEVYLNEINPIPGSGAHYLFDDFGVIIQKMEENLPDQKIITPTYSYINKIIKAKG